ncbi:kelch-like protein 7 [Saccoglossus kowalevskii]|uniref:Kelch-like protein 12-like n=1 Tax=Saccoglossus kowalevskii TaxID=10224 RepID=A0ABM0M321_SACKO|nr:PREDICTED: kelch-like protein 12-like [Saccoglossus kowalevskii]
MATSRELTRDRHGPGKIANDTFVGGILSKLYEQSQEGRLCDVTLKLSDHEFHVHGCVLAANSPVFEVMLNAKIVELGDAAYCNNIVLDINTAIGESKITPYVFGKIIQFMYTGLLEISDDQIEVDDIREATDLLQATGLHVEFQSLHRNRVYSSLCRQRTDRNYCDITLSVEHRDYPAHRCLLAAYSPYFDAMFSNDMSEKGRTRVDLPFLSSEQIELLLGFLYKETVTISYDNVEGVLMAADYLHISQLKETCAQFLCGSITCENCLGYFKLTELYSVPRVSKYAKQFIQRHFTDVIAEDEVLLLSVEELVTLLTDDDNVVEVVQNGTVVTSEMSVFEVMVRWVMENEEKRKMHLPSLLHHVRFSALSCDEQNNILQHPLVAVNTLCLDAAVKCTQNALVSWSPRRGRLINMITVVGVTGNLTSSVMSSYLIEQNKWLSHLKVPLPVQYAGAAFHNNRLYIAGGLEIKYRHRGHFGSATEIVKALYCYNPLINAWHKLPNMLEGVYHHRLLVCNGKLYAMGGRLSIGRLATEFQCHPLGHQSWQFISPPKRLASFREGFLTHTWNSNIYIMSAESLESSGTIDRYNTDTDSWDIITFPNFTPSPTSKVFFTFKHPCIESSQIYVTNFKEVHMIFDLINNKWQIEKHHTVKLDNGDYIENVTAYDDKVYVLGYRMNVYNTKTKTWSKLASYRGCLGKGESCLMMLPSQFLQGSL